MDNQQPSISDFDLGWFCGVIDGEGCIGLWSRGGKRSSEYKPGLRLTNTSKPLVVYIAKAAHAVFKVTTIPAQRFNSGSIRAREGQTRGRITL